MIAGKQGHYDASLEFISVATTAAVNDEFLVIMARRNAIGGGLCVSEVSHAVVIPPDDDTRRRMIAKFAQALGYNVAITKAGPVG